MIRNTKLANTWPWSKEWISLAFWVPGLTGIVLIFLTYPIIGRLAYWFSLINLWGLFFTIIYSYVNKKVKQKKDLLLKQGLEPFDGLVSFGKQQAPAAIGMDNTTLYFQPIVGQPLNYNISKIKKIVMKNSLPGKHLMFKVAYHLTLDNDAIFAFAVNNEVSHIIKPFLIPDNTQ